MKELIGQLRRSGCALAGVALLLVAAGRPVVARASLDEAPRYRAWQIGGFEVRGLDGDLEGELKRGLALAGRSKLIFWRRYPVFDPGDLVADLARARVFLARHGYPSAVFDPVFRADPQDRKVEVTLRVDPGPAVMVAENRTEALPPALEPRARKILELEEGERFADAKVEERVAELLGALTESGYARASVHSRITRIDSTRVSVDFLVDAGQIHTFGPTAVRGVGADLAEVARRTVAIEPGARYSPEKLRAANENLRLLDLFRRIRVHTEPGPGTRLDVVADLAERRMQSLNLGVGYWTEDRVRASARYRHRNILERGRGIGADGSYSRFLQEASVSYWRPTLFRSRTRGSLTLRGKREAEPGYTLRSGEIELAATYIPSRRTSLRPSVTLSLIDMESRTEPPEFEDPGPSLVSGAITWVQEDLDDPLAPTSGQSRSVRFEVGLPGLGFQRDYVRLEPSQSVYVPLAGRRLVLAARAGLGVAGPRRDAFYFLPNRRFYGGGSASFRGIRRNRLGPLDDFDRPFGGVARAEGTLELRFPIFWRIGGLAFGDAGQVWFRHRDVRLDSLRFAVGPGLTLSTPVGPLRSELGVLLGPRRPPERRTVFHLSVGNAF